MFVIIVFNKIHLLIFHKYVFTWSYRQISGHSRHSCTFVPPHKSKMSCFKNVFLCTFHFILRKSLYYPHTFCVHTLAKLFLVRLIFRFRSSNGSATYIIERAALKRFIFIIVLASHVGYVSLFMLGKRIKEEVERIHAIQIFNNIPLLPFLGLAVMTENFKFTYRYFISNRFIIKPSHWLQLLRYYFCMHRSSMF